MLSLIILIGLTVAGSALFLYVACRRLRDRERHERFLRADLKGLTAENERLDCLNSALRKESAQAINLYEVTRDMCRFLDQQKIYALFLEGLKRFIPSGVCFLEKEGPLPAETPDSSVAPLFIDRKMIGYLRCEHIDPQQREIFRILSDQFLLAIRRAILYEQVQGLIITDGLTQTLSRRYFLERFEEELQRSRTFKLNLSFLMIDIDHFKEYNDRYGHLVGDAVLRKVSMILKEKIRQMDFIGRYGGEEISIVLVETDKEQALLAAQRIRMAIQDQELEAYDETVRSTISIGVASFPDDAKTLEELIERADQALYRAKETGRNRVVVA